MGAGRGKVLDIKAALPPLAQSSQAKRRVDEAAESRYPRRFPDEPETNKVD